VDIDIRPFGVERHEEAMRMHGVAFGEEIDDQEIEAVRPLVARSRNLAAVEGDTIVGSTSSYPMEMTVPGGATLPTGGITAVAVLPTHRRRGLGRALMRRQLDELHEQGTPLAYLWASEGRIYQRFGYGMGTYACAFDIRKVDMEILRPIEPRGRTRVMERAEALKVFPSVYERVRPTRPGFIDRNEPWWTEGFLDLERYREGASPYFWTAHESDEGLDGYVVYRVKEGERPSGGFENILEIEELMAATEDAYLSLWRYCFDHDLVGRVKGWKRPIDEPLFHMLAEPRGLDFHVRDGTWLRVVEVESALAGRSYSLEGHLVLDVHDGFCSWNEGRWLLEAGPDGAACRRTDDEPDLELGAAELGALYLGTVPASVLARAGRVVERTPGTLTRADALFASDPEPWCPYIY
jgi:predicted acetyltransferase